MLRMLFQIRKHLHNENRSWLQAVVAGMKDGSNLHGANFLAEAEKLMRLRKEMPLPANDIEFCDRLIEWCGADFDEVPTPIAAVLTPIVPTFTQWNRDYRADSYNPHALAPGH